MTGERHEMKGQGMTHDEMKGQGMTHDEMMQGMPYGITEKH
jgi:hypothetical protein